MSGDEWARRGWQTAGAVNPDEPEAFHRALEADRLAHERAGREALSRLASDLRTAGSGIDTGELALHLAPPRGPVAEVTIAGQRYLAQPREDGQPGLRLVRPVEWPELPEREHR